MEAILRILGAIALWKWADRHDAKGRHDDFMTAIALEGAEAHRQAWERWSEEFDPE